MQDRQLLVGNYIDEKGEMSLRELEALFPDVSSMTLRRDLDALEAEGRIIKIKGGAKSIRHLSRSILFQNVEDDYGHRELENTAAKEAIAEAAAGLAETGCSIFMDAGSTLMCLARRLSEERRFVVTSGINVAMEMARNKHTIVNLIGGQLSRDNLCVAGAGALNHLQNINIDIAFIGASCFSAEAGFTCGDYNECEMKRYVVSKAKKKYVLMDSTKLGRSMPYTFARPEDMDCLITDNTTPMLEEIAQRAGMRLILAQTGGCDH